MRKCEDCGEVKELEKFVKCEVYKGKQYYRHKCKECLNKTLRTGIANTGRFKKGCKNWIGKHHTAEAKAKMSAAKLGKKQTKETIEKKRLALLGQRRKATRHVSRKYWEWRDAVKEKDGWKCQHCGCEDRKRLHAHHIISWAADETKRFEISNGLTLCKNCHAKEETKNVIGKHFSRQTEFKKGQAAWNKGKKHTAESKAKMSQSLKGHIPWNKGLKNDC
ncbi:MAG: HNH endonuclease signature motif containing protein [bacterium]|nr:HNH endonuclease signature motif containing protein [bacterium]